jgi:predicted dehydrogenase
VTRLLLAGTGLIGHRHMTHILETPGLELAGIIDPDPARRALAGVPGFADIDAVDVATDGIVIATPTGTHAALTRAAVSRGWHVLVEKPLADTLEAADAMIVAAEAARVHLLVGHHRRHHPRVQALKRIVASGELGRPVLGSLIWAMRKPDDYFDVDWRSGLNGAPIRQNLIHEVDTLRHLFGEVVHVSGFGSNAVRGAARTESGGAVLGFDSGVAVTIAFADTTPTPWGFEAGTGESPMIPKTGETCLHVACTEGGIEFPSLRIWRGAQDWHERPSHHETPVEDAVPLVRQLQHFASVIDGRADPLVSGREGRATLAATLQIEAATLPQGVTP